MSKENRAPVPVNVISGNLGSGKTTAINHLLRHRPPGERWAVLVNEYGLVGLDAALIESPRASDAGGVEVREVAGGCICCNAGFRFHMSLVLLLQRRPHRLLIEPTGLATLSGILDTLNDPAIRSSVDLRTIICLLDPARIRELLERPHVLDQVEAADVILSTRADLATQEQQAEFDGWANGLFPAKLHVGSIVHGQLDSSLLDLISQRERVVQTAGVEHHTGHEHGGDEHHRESAQGEQIVCNESDPFCRRSHLSAVASTVGWVCWRGLMFDAVRATEWLTHVSAQPGTRRVKAVLRTDQGWRSLNVADGVAGNGESGYRRDSRIEFVFDGEPPVAPEELERQLRELVLAASTTL